MTRSYNRDHRIVRALVCTDFGTLLIQSIIEQIAGIGTTHGCTTGSSSFRVLGLHAPANSLISRPT